MAKLIGCPFCGDEDATAKTVPCTFTRPDHFMSQVFCGHCGATGTRYCGEEDAQECEAKAVQAWNSTAPVKSERLSTIYAFNTQMMQVSGAIWLTSTYVFDGDLAKNVEPIFIGSVIFGMILWTFRRYRTRRAERALIA